MLFLKILNSVGKHYIGKSSLMKKSVSNYLRDNYGTMYELRLLNSSEVRVPNTTNTSEGCLSCGKIVNIGYNEYIIPAVICRKSNCCHILHCHCHKDIKFVKFNKIPHKNLFINNCYHMVSSDSSSFIELSKSDDKLNVESSFTIKLGHIIATDMLDTKYDATTVVSIDTSTTVNYSTKEILFFNKSFPFEAGLVSVELDIGNYGLAAIQSEYDWSNLPKNKNIPKTFQNDGKYVSLILFKNSFGIVYLKAVKMSIIIPLQTRKRKVMTRNSSNKKRKKNDKSNLSNKNTNTFTPTVRPSKLTQENDEIDDEQYWTLLNESCHKVVYYVGEGDINIFDKVISESKKQFTDKLWMSQWNPFYFKFLSGKYRDSNVIFLDREVYELMKERMEIMPKYSMKMMNYEYVIMLAKPNYHWYMIVIYPYDKYVQVKCLIIIILYILFE